jgi:hypothetical protein
MTVNQKTMKFPRPADPTIEEVLRTFLDVSAQRLKPATFRKYKSVIELFTISMNDYGSGKLSKAETVMFEALYNAQGAAHREYCQVFGPEKIMGNVSEFLGYFMPRKVMCGKELMRAAGTVTKKLAQWLHEQGIVDTESAEAAMQTGATAAKALPAAERLAEALYDYCRRHPVDDWSDEIDDHFTVEKVQPDRLHLTPLLGDPGEDETIVLHLPQAITALCQVGWEISLALGKTSKGWRILESGTVYAL